MRALTATREEMCYCPGCSHGLLLERLGEAIDRCGLPMERICIVSDIGCIGTADRYFSCHTFHGLHGRSFTYAEGIQRRRPELLTIVLVGDGGCGIGTAHLVHAARRGAAIKVIVCNNFNFGMTGGQHSPTTPPAALTPTTPGGFRERSFDIAETAGLSGATFVARASAHAPGLAAMLDAVLRAPGFALIDVWELCAAYFVQDNKLSPARLPQLAEQLEMRFGVLVDRSAQTPEGPPRPPRAVRAAAAPRTPCPRLPWRARTEISLAGSAGQHIRSAVGAIGEIAVAGGLFAAEHDDYPITVRKGFSISNLIIDARPILYAGLDRADIAVVLSADGLARLGGLERLPPTCTLFLEQSLPAPAAGAALRRFELEPFTRAATRAGAALAVLTFALLSSGRLSPGELCDAAQAALHGPHRDANLKAIAIGAERASAADCAGGISRPVTTGSLT